MQSFLQTPEWLSFQRSLGRTVWRLDDGFIQANVIRHDIRGGKSFLYIPHGPRIKEGSVARDHIHHFTGHLKKMAREQGSIFIKVEPLLDDIVDMLMRNGMRLRLSQRSLQPSKTVLIALLQDHDALLSNLHHKTRYNIKLAGKKGIRVAELTDTEPFLTLMKKTTRDKFRSHPPEYYRSMLTFFQKTGGGIKTRLFAALHEGAPIAAAIILEHGNTAYYLHGASDPEYRALMAPHLLHWELIERYKGAGFSTYDFWGIDHKRYPGVTRFKLSWGGRVVEYPGSFDMAVKPFWHWLWQMRG